MKESKKEAHLCAQQHGTGTPCSFLNKCNKIIPTVPEFFVLLGQDLVISKEGCVLGYS